MSVLDLQALDIAPERPHRRPEHQAGERPSDLDPDGSTRQDGRLHAGPVGSTLSVVLC